MAEIDKATLEWLDTEIRRHAVWRTRWSFLYFFFAATTIVAGAATTAVAGLASGKQVDVTMWTTALAAITTIFASLEKVLKFREKWDLHRTMQVTLEMIRLRASNGLLDVADLLDRLDATAQNYSSQLSELTSSAAPAAVERDAGGP